ncbi:hypothetical protein QBC43DRAFT_330986 [Cladorrhinum sp. PSN259]|nr:hypothetical protein QBC43DRAFT_330986 [Cladorrhinum sp. PSN259]
MKLSLLILGVLGAAIYANNCQETSASHSVRLDSPTVAECQELYNVLNQTISADVPRFNMTPEYGSVQYNYHSCSIKFRAVDGVFSIYLKDLIHVIPESINQYSSTPDGSTIPRIDVVGNIKCQDADLAWAIGSPTPSDDGGSDS